MHTNKQNFSDQKKIQENSAIEIFEKVHQSSINIVPRNLFFICNEQTRRAKILKKFVNANKKKKKITNKLPLEYRIYSTPTQIFSSMLFFDAPDTINEIFFYDYLLKQLNENLQEKDLKKLSAVEKINLIDLYANFFSHKTIVVNNLQNILKSKSKEINKEKIGMLFSYAGYLSKKIRISFIFGSNREIMPYIYDNGSYKLNYIPILDFDEDKLYK